MTTDAKPQSQPRRSTRTPPAELADRVRGLLRRERPSATGWTGVLVRTALPIALGLWVVALHTTHLAAMGTLGLLQALPPIYWAAAFLLTVGFAAAVRVPRLRRRWAALYVLALIALIHATPTLLYPSLRYAWAWKHLAVVDAMLRHGGTVPHAGDLDIYNSWPGFFQLNALFLRATGLHSALGYAAWYPVLANLLLLGPLLLLYRAVTEDRRLVWGGVWVFYATSWAGQDYFSPQAFAYLLFVLVLALLFRRLAEVRSVGDGSASPTARAVTSGLAPRRDGWAPAHFALLVVLVAGIVTSHPLTPLMLISVLVLLALPRRNRRVVLPLLATTVGLTFAWDDTVARSYIAANVRDLIGRLSAGYENSRPTASAQLGTVARDQVIASYLTWATTGTVLLLAGVALFRDRSLRHSSLPLALFAPLPLLLSNNYGGEMVIRAYLFMLPAAALLAAATLLRPGRCPRARAVVSTAMLSALLAGLFCGYYGKESMNYFSAQEVAAMRYLNGVAPPGARIVSVTGAVPGGEQNYDQTDRVVLTLLPAAEQRLVIQDPLAGLAGLVRQPTRAAPAYLVLSRAQIAECETTGLLPADTVQRLAAVAARSPAFHRVYSTPDAVIYRYVLQGPQQHLAEGSLLP